MLIGSFTKSGSPALKINVAGPVTQGRDFEAILDTGFTGFLSMPLIQAMAVGLILHGTTAISFADGRTSFRMTAQGMVTIGGETKIGVVILEPNSNDLLLGMGFLRMFKKNLFVLGTGILLTGEDELGKAVAAVQVPQTPPTPPVPSLS